MELLGMAWACWTARNSLVMHNDHPNVHLLVTRFANMIKDHATYMLKVHGEAPQAVPRSPNKWLPPPLGWVKINTDAAVLGTTSIGLGWVTRDSSGAILAAGVRRLNVCWTPEMAEWMAARWALDVARTQNWRQVILESDSLALVTKLQRGRTGRSVMDRIHDDIRCLVSGFVSFLCCHIKREGNSVAHSLARLAPAVGDEQIFSTKFPTCIRLLAALDMQ